MYIPPVSVCIPHGLQDGFVLGGSQIVLDVSMQFECFPDSCVCRIGASGFSPMKTSEEICTFIIYIVVCMCVITKFTSSTQK